MAGATSPPCAQCGATDARTSLDDTPLCDRCFNDHISRQTGWAPLPDPPPVETVRTGDGRKLRFRYRLSWAPTGVLSAEAEQVDQPPGEGFRFSVSGEHDADPDTVLARLRRVVHREVGRSYLVPDEFASSGDDPRWMIADDEVFGWIGWSGNASVREPAVVIDGRHLDWDEFGRMVASFEGWQFRMVLSDNSDHVGAGTGGQDADDAAEDAEVISLFGDRASGNNAANDADDVDDAGDAADVATAQPSIDEVLTYFLDDQNARLSAPTYARYEGIVELLYHCLNSYGYESLAGSEAKAWQAAFESGDHRAFTRLFGPDRIVEMYGEFLGYFMLRKVFASKQQLKDAGTVTKRLARWLGEQGYVDPDTAEQARTLAAQAGRRLTRADEFGEHLFRQAQRTRLPVAPNDIPDEDWVEDHLPITRIEDGRLWFGDLGPVQVPTSASALAEVGWYVTVVLACVDGSWRLVEVGAVDP